MTKSESWLVCGARTWTKTNWLWVRLDQLATERGTPFCVIHGGARGADRMADAWADEHRVHIHEVLPDWDRYGRRAGFVRNMEMLDLEPDLVVAFLAGESRGTRHTIREAEKRGIPVVTQNDQVSPSRGGLHPNDGFVFRL